MSIQTIELDGGTQCKQVAVAAGAMFGVMMGGQYPKPLFYFDGFATFWVTHVELEKIGDHYYLVCRAGDLQVAQVYIRPMYLGDVQQLLQEAAA